MNKQRHFTRLSRYDIQFCIKAAFPWATVLLHRSGHGFSITTNPLAIYDGSLIYRSRIGRMLTTQDLHDALRACGNYRAPDVTP